MHSYFIPHYSKQTPLNINGSVFIRISNWLVWCQAILACTPNIGIHQRRILSVSSTTTSSVLSSKSPRNSMCISDSISITPLFKQTFVLCSNSYLFPSLTCWSFWIITWTAVEESVALAFILNRHVQCNAQGLRWLSFVQKTWKA